MKITVNALIGLLAQQAIWKYELKFVGFSNKYKLAAVARLAAAT